MDKAREIQENFNDIANGREAECCVDCGFQYLTKKQKENATVCTFNIGICCICGKEKHVTNIRHYNYLKTINNMNNKCAGIWVRAIKRLPIETDKYFIRVHREKKSVAYYRKDIGFEFLFNGKTAKDISDIEWLDESIKEDKPVEGTTDEEIEAMAEKEFPTDKIYDAESIQAICNKRLIFIKGYKAAIRDKLSKPSI